MAQYSILAKYYDALMDGVDYAKWADFYVKCFEKYGRDVKTVVDIGCGTGSITTELAARGYAMTGVDISAEMLALAERKAEERGARVRYAEQDMVCLDTGAIADAVICSFDGVNYLTDLSDVRACFSSVYETLAPCGLFIFDVSSPYKFKNILGDNAFVYELDDMFLSWQCFYSEKRGVCDYYLTFFERDGGAWQRYDETQRQRAYSARTLEKIIKESGMSLVAKFSDIDFSPVKDDSDRIFFICRKD